MKKLLLTTALIAVGSASFASPAYHGPTTSTGWSAAAQVRDSLTTTYEGLGGTWSATDTQAVNNYAELLYRIDNLGATSALNLQVADGDTDITINGTTVTVPDGHLYAEGGDSTGLFTLDEVVTQVDNFVGAVENDLFGTTDGTRGGYADNAYPHPAVPNTNNGLAIDRLNDIIMDINTANTIILDPTSTHADRDNAINDFYALFATKSEGFNNAVDALTNISNISFETAGVINADFDLNGAEALVNNVVIVESITDTDANIEVDTDGNGTADTAYESYTDYVLNMGDLIRQAPTTVAVTLGLTTTTHNYELLVDASIDFVTVSPTQANASATYTATNSNTYTLTASGTQWQVNGITRGTLQEAIDYAESL